MSKCAPEREGKYKNGCLTTKELSIIAEENNIVTKKASRQSLIKDINKHLTKQCKDDDQLCWSIKTKPALAENFRPKVPDHWLKDKKSWLSNFDILATLNQYEKKYKRFKFLGVFSVDFQKTNTCYINKDCLFFNPKRYKQKQFAMVINLSRHDQPGTHWVAVFFNLIKSSKQYGMFYYDSVGHKEPKDIKDFHQNVVNVNGFKDFPFSYNKSQHQYQNSECGVFVINFIISCLVKQDKTYEEICKDIKTYQTDTKDSKIFKQRFEFFNW